MQQFWIRFLIILSSALTAQAALAIPLLINISHTTSSLLIGSSVHQDLTIDEFVINKANNKNLYSNLSKLLQHKAVSQLVNELQQSINLANECRTALVHSWENAVYRQSFQQQKNVYNTIQAQQNACFQGQASYQAERQKTALLIS